MEYHFKMPVMDRMRYTGTENKQEEMSLQMNTISSALIYNWHQRQLPDRVRLNRDAQKKKSDPIFQHCDGSVNQRDNTVQLNLTFKILRIFISKTVALGQEKEWNKHLSQKQRKQDRAIYKMYFY